MVRRRRRSVCLTPTMSRNRVRFPGQGTDDRDERWTNGDFLSCGRCAIEVADHMAPLLRAQAGERRCSAAGLEDRPQLDDHQSCRCANCPFADTSASLPAAHHSSPTQQLIGGFRSPQVMDRSVRGRLDGSSSRRSRTSGLELLTKPEASAGGYMASMIEHASSTIVSFAEGRVRPLGRPAAPHRML